MRSHKLDSESDDGVRDQVEADLSAVAKLQTGALPQQSEDHELGKCFI